MSEWNRRVATAQACVDRFSGQPFKWGKNDCVRVAAMAVRRLGITPMLAKAGSYASERGAMRALVRSGHSDLLEAMDAHGFARIPASSAWPADIVALESPGAFGAALAVYLGGGNYLGCLEGEENIVIFRRDEFLTAWRVA